MTKTFTAEEFSNKPLQVYRSADKGEQVTINHSRYPDVVFELTVRARRGNLEDATTDRDQRLKNFITALYAERVEGLINSREFIDKIMEVIE